MDQACSCFQNKARVAQEMSQASCSQNRTIDFQWLESGQDCPCHLSSMGAEPIEVTMVFGGSPIMLVMTGPPFQAAAIASSSDLV